MRRDKKSFKEILELVKAARPQVSPNDGFLRQLEEYEQMKFTLEGESELHQRFQKEILPLAKKKRAEILEESVSLE